MSWNLSWAPHLLETVGGCRDPGGFSHLADTPFSVAVSRSGPGAAVRISERLLGHSGPILSQLLGE